VAANDESDFGPVAQVYGPPVDHLPVLPVRREVRGHDVADAFEAIVDASGNVLNTDGDRQ
jgi:hypothetical protein